MSRTTQRQWTGSVDATKGQPRTDAGRSAPVDPPLPPVLAPQPPGKVVLSTVSGRISLSVKGVVLVSGGDAQVIATDIVGRAAGTSMSDRSLMTASAECIVSRSRQGESVHEVVAWLCSLSATGQLVRLYGPVAPPGKQGMVWTLAMPQVADSALMLADGRLSHAPLSLAFQQWNPIAGSKIRKAGGAKARSREKAYAKTYQSEGLQAPVVGRGGVFDGA